LTAGSLGCGEFPTEWTYRMFQGALLAYTPNIRGILSRSNQPHDSAPVDTDISVATNKTKP
jgi:hypothetical protein